MFSGHKAGGAIGESNLGSSLFRRYNCTRSRASSYATTAWRSYENKDVEPPIRTLQLGLGWSPEWAGGIQRVSYELLRHLPRSGVEVDGLVAGSSHVVRDSAGRVRAFAPADAPLLVRWRALCRELRQMLSERQPDAVISHFALYTFPVLDLVRSHPLVIHFHGPWAQESRVEGD
jgi:hypothetical protein